MGILQDLEGMRYRFAIDLINNEEVYDKKRNIVVGTDVFNMCLKRYRLMQGILLPLKNKLGDEIDVTDITFINSNDDEKGIIVKYMKDDKLYLLSISNLDYEDINVVASDLRVQNGNFITANRKVILRTFRNISDNDLDEDIIVKSTSSKFIIKDNCDTFNVKDAEGKIFSFDSKYSTYEKNGNLNNSLILNCNYPKLKEILENKENIRLIFNHLHFYEEDLPKQLIKKLTNC